MCVYTQAENSQPLTVQLWGRLFMTFTQGFHVWIFHSPGPSGRYCLHHTLHLTYVQYHEGKTASANIMPQIWMINRHVRNVRLLFIPTLHKWGVSVNFSVTPFWVQACSFPLFTHINSILYPPPECTDLHNPRKGRRRAGVYKHVGPSDVKINIGLYHWLNKW